jgi:hypothetical protein
MSETPSAPVTGTADNSGLVGHVIAHVEKWAEQHIAPDIARVLKFAEAHAANAQRVASLVLSLAQQFDPAAYPAVAAIVTEAEKTAAEAEKIAAELLGKM